MRTLLLNEILKNVFFSRVLRHIIYDALYRKMQQQVGEKLVHVCCCSRVPQKQVFFFIGSGR